MSLRLLLTLAGALEILAGLAALITPAPVVSLLLGAPMDPIASVMARFFGAGVFALGLACLKARHDATSPAGLAVSLGITGYNILAAVVLLWAAAWSGLGGPLLWAPGIGLASDRTSFASSRRAMLDRLLVRTRQTGQLSVLVQRAVLPFEGQASTLEPL